MALNPPGSLLIVVPKDLHPTLMKNLSRPEKVFVKGVLAG